MADGTTPATPAGRGDRAVRRGRQGRPSSSASAGWLDERTGVAAVDPRSALRKVFPDHWSFLLGEIALFCFVILVATGIFLTFFYTPDARETIYDGAYAPLRGRGGLGRVRVGDAPLVRGPGRAADAPDPPLGGARVRRRRSSSTCARVFFTGAFRRPREINWLIGVGLLLLALGEGFTGYSLPDDLLSGTGLRIIVFGRAVDPVHRPLGRRRCSSAASSRRPSPSAACSCSTSCCCRA